MVSVECCSCGCVFGVPDYWYKKRREDHEWFYCPNGHKQHYAAETEAERYQRMYNAEAEKSLEVREKLAALERKYARTESAFKRHKKRNAAGVCEHCNRTFSQLAKHMQTQHPEVVALQGLKVQKQLTDGSKPN